MRVLLFGAEGQLGQSIGAAVLRLQDAAKTREASDVLTLVCAPRSVDISQESLVLRAVREANPDWVVNAAAVTNVDGAHEDPKLAMDVNALGAAFVAKSSHAVGARMIQISTEAVFDGESNASYVESDQCNPVSVYGASKLSGEFLTSVYQPESLVLRTSWLYSKAQGANFPTRLLEQLSAHDRPVKVVTDVVGNPTPTDVLADAVVALVKTPVAPGVYHVCCQGNASKYEWALEVARSAGFDRDRIEPAVAANYPTVAKRPRHVDLSCDKFLATGAMLLPDWRSAWQVLSSQ